MEVILETRESLGKLASGMRMYPQLLKNIRVADKKVIMENEQVKALDKQIAEELGERGRILLRESGTEPVIRVMVEAETDELCEKYVGKMVDLIETLI